MKPSALVLMIGIGMGATACGSSQTTPATPSNSDGDSSEAPSGAANKQAGDNPARLLTHDECVSLGQLVSDACRDIHARSAQVEGWCGDIVSGYDSGSWVEECAKHIHVIDSMCFRTANNARGMMSCDRTVDH